MLELLRAATATNGIKEAEALQKTSDALGVMGVSEMVTTWTESGRPGGLGLG